MKDKIVKEWFERGQHDLESAKFLEVKGYYDVVFFHIHQAVEKYLKGYLIWHGWELKKIHDLETLLTEASEFDKSLTEFLDFGRKLTGFYYEERYPPGPIPWVSKEEVKEAIEIAEKIVKSLKSVIE